MRRIIWEGHVHPQRDTYRLVVEGSNAWVEVKDQDMMYGPKWLLVSSNDERAQVLVAAASDIRSELDRLRRNLPQEPVSE